MDVHITNTVPNTGTFERVTDNLNISISRYILFNIQYPNRYKWALLLVRVIKKKTVFCL